LVSNGYLTPNGSLVPNGFLVPSSYLIDYLVPQGSLVQKNRLYITFPNGSLARRLQRRDSNHPTLVMVNKWNEEDIRKKFRNYEI
jgi:hypothetical protein